MTAFSSILRLAKPVQGQLDGTWGDTVNNSVTQMIEEAIAGSVTITVSGNFTLTTANGATDQSRPAIIILAGSPGSAANMTTAGTLTKHYIVKNGTGQTITFKTASGSGTAIPNGKTMFLYCDGADIVEANDHHLSLSVDNLTIDGNSITATDTDGDVDLVPNGTGEVKVGTGSANAELTSSGAHNLILSTNSGTDSGKITITDAADQPITIEPNGAGTTVIKRLVPTTFAVPISAQAGTSYTLDLEDMGAVVTFENSSAVSLTLPDGSSVFGSNYHGGTITLVNRGSSNGIITITVPDGNTLTWCTGSSLVTVAPSGSTDSTRKIAVGGVVTLIYEAADKYLMMGSGIS